MTVLLDENSNMQKISIFQGDMWGTGDKWVMNFKIYRQVNGCKPKNGEIIDATTKTSDDSKVLSSSTVLLFVYNSNHGFLKCSSLT